MPNLFRALTLLWMGVIFYFSSLTSQDLKTLPAISDILAHGAIYFVLGALVYFALTRYRELLTVFIAALYGLSDEFHQSFIPGRTPELKDLLVDTGAALMAVVIIKLANRLRKNR